MTIAQTIADRADWNAANVPEVLESMDTGQVDTKQDWDAGETVFTFTDDGSILTMSGPEVYADQMED